MKTYTNKKRKSVVVVGFGSGGFAATFELCRSHLPFDIHVVDTKEYDLLHNCGLPYLINREIPKPESLTHNLGELPITRHHPCRATSVDRKNKTITITHVQTGKRTMLHYDFLIVATGSRAFIPPIDGIADILYRSAFPVHTLEDIERIIAHKGRRAVVVGAGAIGLETAACLDESGYKVTVLEPGSFILKKVLEIELAELVDKYLRHRGIRVLTHHRADAVQSTKGKLISVKAMATMIPADLLIIATGIRPNTEFLRDTDLLNEDCSLTVNDHLQTRDRSVFALGDIVMAKHVLSGKLNHCGLATLAYLQGQAAARFIMGQPHSQYPGVFNTFVTKVGKMEIASCGLNTTDAKEDGYEPLATIIKKSTNPDWFPGGHDLAFELIADMKSQKIIGAQCVGKEGAAARINIISAALKGGLDIYKLRELELAYCPPVSDVTDVVTVAADMLCRRAETKQ